jgi:hypothetical protein
VVRRPFVKAATIALVSTIAGTVAAYRPVLHELIPDDPREDARIGATTPDGRLPLALETPSGLVRAPDQDRARDPSRAAYAERLPGTSGATYEADRSTNRPGTVGYSDPFSPTVAPYKRLSAFDEVGADYRLRVRGPLPVRQPVVGEKRADEDVFYGDLDVDVAAGQIVRIPSVAPGARVLRMSTTPTIPLDLAKDSADNWFAMAVRDRVRVRLLVEMAAPRASFGGAFSVADRDEGRPVPANVERDAMVVARAIGVETGMAKDEILAKMVAYFRSFAPSSELPREGGGIYLDLALSKKGVCRHRAYAFTVTALALRIPTRMVLNEAHAWVEIRGEREWHRVDLGGAADEIAMASDDRPAHRPPADPFAWPPSAERASGRDALSSAADVPAAPSASPAPSVRAAASAAPSVSAAPSGGSAVVVVAVSADTDAKRGGPLMVKGRALRGDAPCARSLVSIVLVPRRGGQGVSLGALATDRRGEFRGPMVLPTRMPVGDYDVTASAESCAAEE